MQTLKYFFGDFRSLINYKLRAPFVICYALASWLEQKNINEMSSLKN